MNIHRQTFEDILSIKPKDNKNCSLVDKTSYNVTFKNLGKIFDYSAMYEKTLSEKAQHLQTYAEQIAKKYHCKVSYRAVYSTTGRIDDLWKVREELFNIMHVSPVFWAPLYSCTLTGNGSFHFKTFVFGFYPYARKQQFDNIDTENSIDDEILYDEKNASRQLCNLIAWRQDKVLHNEKSGRIRLESDDEKLYYTFCPRYDNIINDKKYALDLSAQEYFQAVVKENNTECFVIPEYKMMFAYNKDSGIDNKLLSTWNILRTRIAVSDMTMISYKGHYCYAFSYDDTRIDCIARHLCFFDTLNLYNF